MPTQSASRIERIAKDGSKRIALLGVVGMLVISILTTFDVVILRGLFNSPIAGSNEFFSTIFAVAIAAVLPSGLASRAMLDVDIFSAKLGRRGVEFCRMLGAVAMLLMVALVAWQVTDYAIQSYQQRLQTIILQWKLWPFFALIAIIFIVCVFVQFATLVGWIREYAFAGREADNTSAASNRSSGARLGKAILAIAVFTVVLVAIFYLLPAALRATFSGREAILAGVLFLALWLLILFIMPVAFSLFFAGVFGAAVLLSLPVSLPVIGSETVGLITNADLAVIPLFLMMGNLATAGGMASDLYRLASAVFGFQRGGLAMATIGGCAGFGALTGSSLATVATIGSAALPEMDSRGYSRSLSTGCIAAGGTLGQIVPPSSAAVIYALLSDQSIGALYIAMLVPAFISILAYIGVTSAIVSLRPDSAPGRIPFNLRELLVALKGSMSCVFLFVVVIGGIFMGIFTATEAAAVGVLIAFCVAVYRGRLTWSTLLDLSADTTKSTAMIYFVLIGASAFTFFSGVAGLPQLLTNSLLGLGLTPLMIVLLLALIYIVLGSVMDSFTILILTTPIVAAVMVSLGFDLIWWGVIMVMVTEIGLISPPFGINLFVMKSIAPDTDLKTIYRGVMPFVAVDIFKTFILILFPSLTLWLTYYMK